ncbi:MAG: BrnA antitoxin family protein [Acidobacteria bacterium]|nr:BrnA antitoxin family protein [Acidobacteriota bacterium]
MENKTDLIPDNMTIMEASEFWDTHSTADYPSTVVQFEYKPGGRVTFVAIAEELKEQLVNRAKKSGISIETLVNLWIQEKLTA